MNESKLLLISVFGCVPLVIAVILVLVRRNHVQQKYAQSVQNRVQAIKRRALVDQPASALLGLVWELNYVQTNYILTYKQLREVRQLQADIKQRIK